MDRRVGRYRLLGALSSGGMATVHLGVRDSTSTTTQIVAIKRLHDPHDVEQRSMLRDEARLVSRIRHANVVRVIELIDQPDELALVMDYVHGPSLGAISRELAADRQLVPLSIITAIARDILAGLHAAHEACDESNRPLAIVHRDVSPQNLLVAADGTTRVVDFGVAHAADRMQRTVHGQVKGKPWYMAPEQAMGIDVDRRVDVYAAAVVVWELVTNERLFPADTATGAMLRHSEEAPRSPSELRDDVPPELDQVIVRGLAKRADDRYATARDLADALTRVVPPASQDEVRAWLATHQRAFFVERDTIVEAAGRDPAMTPVSSPTVRPARRRRAGVAAIGAAGVVAAALGIGWLATTSESASDTKAAAGIPATTSPVPRGTRDAPIKLVIPAFDNTTGDADLDALATIVREIINDSSETITGGLRKTTAAARELRPDGAIDEATWIRAAARTNSTAIVLGTVARTSAGFRIGLRVIEPQHGERWLDRHVDVATRDLAVPAIAGLTVEVRALFGDTATADQRTRSANAFGTTTLQAASAYARASTQTQDGGWDEAVREATAAVAADPSFAAGQFALGLAYSNAGRNEDAERAYRAALGHLDRLSESNRLMASGLYFMVRREPDKAIEQLEQYVARYPANFGGRLDLANAYFSARRMTQAQESGRRGYDMSKLPVALANVALYAAYAGDFDESIRAAHEVIAGGSEMAETALLALAHGQLGRDHRDEAHAAYAELAKLSATGASRAVVGDADLAIAQGRLDEAARLLRAGVAVDEQAKAVELARVKQALLAEVLLRTGHVDEAIALADKVVAASHQLGVLVPAGRVYAAAHVPARAKAVIGQLELHTDAEARSYAALLEGDVLLESGHARDALARFDHARTIQDTWLARYDSARAYLALELYPEAYQALEVCAKRHGEALALFLDDVPTYHHWVLAMATHARAEAGLAEQTRPPAP